MVFARLEKLTHKSYLLWGIIFVAAFVVYSPALSNYFSQEDFVHLSLVKSLRAQDAWQFFLPIEQGIFYRPLSVQAYTWSSWQLFGLNPFGYHVIALGFHLANIYLVYLLLSLFVANQKLAYLGAFMYGLHPVHFMSLFWIAEFSMVLAPFFAFLALHSFWEKRFYWFWLWAFLGLLSNELAASVPLILGVYLLIKRRFKELAWLLPPVLMVFAVMLWRFVVFPTSLGTEYGLSFSWATLWNNGRWHFFRASGFPEAFRAYLHLLGMQITLVALTIFWVGWLWRRGFSLKKNQRQAVLFGLLWFMAALLPVAFLAEHQSPIYQIIGLPGFILVVLLLFPRNASFLKVSILGVLFFIAAYWAVRAQETYHWVTNRARLAQYHIEKLQRHSPEPGMPVLFLNTTPNSSSQVYFALGGGKGVEVFFGQETPVFFEDISDQATYSNSTVYVFSRMDF